MEGGSPGLDGVSPHRFKQGGTRLGGSLALPQRRRCDIFIEIHPSKIKAPSGATSSANEQKRPPRWGLGIIGMPCYKEAAPMELNGREKARMNFGDKKTFNIQRPTCLVETISLTPRFNAVPVGSAKRKSV